MSATKRNRRLGPTELYTPPKAVPKNRRLTPLELRLGYRSRDGVLTDFMMEVFVPCVTLAGLTVLAFLTFFL